MLAPLIERQFGLAPEKQRRLAHFFFLAVTLLTVDVLAMTLAESLFLSNAGAERMPVFYMLLAAVSVPVVTLYSQLVDRWARPRLFRYLLFGCLAAVLGLDALLGLGTTPVFFAVYIGFSLIELLVDIQFWVLVADYFTSLELKRGAVLLAMAMAAGGLAGGGLASALSGSYAPGALILLLPVFYLAAFGQILFLERWQKPLEESQPEEEEESGLVESVRSFPPLMRRYPIILLLALGALLAVVIRCVAEFQVFTIFEESFPDEQELTGFLGLLGAGLSVLEFAAIFFITRPLITRLGVSRMAVIYPVTTLASFAGLAAAFRLPTAIAVNVNYETLGNSVASPVENLTYNAVPRRFLGRVRGITNGLFYPGGTALAGGLLLAAQLFLNEFQITLIGIGLSLVFVGVGWRVGKAYLASLVEMLRSRSVNLDDVQEGLGKLPAQYAEEVRGLLRSDDRNAQVLGIELAARMNPADFLPELQALLPSADVSVRRALVKLYAAFHPQDLTRQIRAMLDAENETVREMALEALLAGREPLDRRTLLRLLRDPSPVVRGLACVAAGQGAADARDGELESLRNAVLDSELPPAAHLAMIQGLRSLAAGAAKAAPEMVALLRRVLERADASVKDDALEALAALPIDYTAESASAAAQDMEALAAGYLDHPEAPVRTGAVRLLGRVRSERALERLCAALEDAHQSVREAAASALAEFGEQALPRVEPCLRSLRPEVVDAAITAAGGTRSRKAEEILFCFLEPTYTQVARNLQWLPCLPAGAEWLPLRAALEDSAQRATRRVLHVLAALGHGRTLNCVRRILYSSDQRIRADAVETLGSLSHRRFVEPILSFLERQAAGDSHAPAPDQPGGGPTDRGGAGILQQALDSPDRWVVVAALSVMSLGPEPIPVNLLKDHPDPLVQAALLNAMLAKTYYADPHRAAAAEELARERSQYMNRVLFLKNIPLFKFLSLDDLLIVDAALVQKDYLAGETIFTEGSLGGDLCLVSRGSVAIRKKLGAEERELARLGPGQCFGEMALFDDAPRSATAVALADCTLLTLERSRFLTLVAQRPEIAMEVCKVLSLRLRDANERLGKPAQDAALAS